VEGGGDDGIGVGGKDEYVRSGPSSLGLEAWNTRESCRIGTGSLNLIRGTRRGNIGCGWRGPGEESSWCSESRKFGSSSLSCVDENEISFPLLVLEDRGRRRRRERGT
jgi:hypothetical protein